MNSINGGEATAIWMFGCNHFYSFSTRLGGEPLAMWLTMKHPQFYHNLPDHVENIEDDAPLVGAKGFTTPQ